MRLLLACVLLLTAVFDSVKGSSKAQTSPLPSTSSTAVSSSLSSTTISPTIPPSHSTGEKEKVQSQHLKVKNVRIVSGQNLIKHEVKAELDGHMICVYEKAPRSSEVKGTILLIHGRTWSSLPVFDLNYESMDANGKLQTVNLSTMDQLVSKGIRVFAIDLRGFGGTTRDESGWLTPYKAVDDIKSVIKWLSKDNGVNLPCLLGWSQGGLVAHLFAQRYPHLISSCILYASIYDQKVIHKRDSFLYRPPTPKSMKTTMDMAVEDFTLHGTISDEAGYAFGLSALQACPTKPDWTCLHEFNECNPAKISVPSLVIHGDTDPYIVKQSQLDLYADISCTDKCYTSIPGADHCAHLIGSKFAFIHHVVSFIRRPAHSPGSNESGCDGYEEPCIFHQS